MSTVPRVHFVTKRVWVRKFLQTNKPIRKEPSVNGLKPIVRFSVAISVLLLAAAVLIPAQVNSQGKDATEVRYTAKFSLDDLSF
jgi:hypothetical protein